MKKYAITILSILLITSYGYTQPGTDKPKYEILTKKAGSLLGTIEIELFPAIAPLHTNNFDSLVNDQFFDSTAFHRVVPGFVIQGGDPNSINGPVSTWGQGQPWQVSVPAEFSVVRHLRGIIGAARDTDPNSANSQFYICVANATFLDGNYTVFGKVNTGMSIVDSIVNTPRDGNDVPLQKIEMFVTYIGVNDSIPDAPVLTSPADGSTGILNTQSFVWSAVNSAVMYTIELSTDPGFSTIDISQNAGINSAMISSLSGSAVYYWRVKSNNGGHESAYTNVRSFTSATSAPILVYPPDISNGISVNPVFSWDPVPNADSYTLQVSVSSTFTAQNMVYNTAGLTGTSQQVNGLNPNSLYYWRVRSASGAIQGFYSVKYSFTTGTSTGIDEQISGVYFTELFPNPATETINFSVNAPGGSKAVVMLNDMLGRNIYAASSEFRNKKFDHSIPVADFLPGMYQLSIEINGMYLNRKVLIR